MTKDIVIIGSGPAGLTAGIYGVRAGYDVCIIDSSPVSGGQILNTYEVDNYPGLPGISGVMMGETFRKHCEKLGVPFVTATVKAIEKVEEGFIVRTRKDEIQAKNIILATGASNKKLGVPGEEELSGMGVSYCATCDGAFFKDKVVAVVGGGDVAVEDAIYLARSSKKVYLIHRRDEFRAAQILVDEAKACDNIEIIYDTVVNTINGTDMVESLTVTNVKTNAVSELQLDGVFIAVGTEPNSSLYKGLCELDDKGYVVAAEDCRTTQDGLYAAGDVRTKKLRQVITACADGANAVTSIG